MKFPSYAMLGAGLLLTLVLLPMRAFAVSLGDEMILSRLGDPVEVEIEVLQWEDMDLERVQISAASRDEYEVFKLTWLPVLEHLNFNLVGPDLDGKVRVLISSRDPLDEPFLELLLVLRWPGGSLRREYVLLFDPPGVPVAVAQPVDAAPPAGPERTTAAPVAASELPPPIVATEPESTVGPAIEQPDAVAPIVGTTDVISPAVETTSGVASAIVDAEAVMPPALVEDASEEAPAIAEAEPEVAAPAMVEAETEPVAPSMVEVEPEVVAPAIVEAETEPLAPASTEAETEPVAPAIIAAETEVVALLAGAREAEPASERTADTATSAQLEPLAEPESHPAGATPEPAVIMPPPNDTGSEVISSDSESVVAEEDTPEVEPATAAAPPEEPGPDARTQVAIEVETLAPPAAAAPIDTTRRTYQVRAGDSLWNIARQFRPAGAGENLYQMLLGIHDLNRNSFINGNISLLKANALLQMPNEADIAAIDAAGAQAEFDRRWESGTQRFDAAQRGEAIPLFVNDVPADEPAAPIEPELPPGTELPPPAVDDSGLVMVSDANAAQPLQLAPADDAAADTAVDVAVPAAAPVSLPDVGETIGDVADAEPASVPQAEMASEEIGVEGGNGEADTAERAAVSPEDVGSQSSIVTRQLATTTTVIATADLETELAAMRARRETAEALARQLQESLQRAQAERAAQAALFGPRNLPLAGGVLALVLALVAGVVFLLKLAGELRTARIEADATPLMPRGRELPAGRARTPDSGRNSPPRTEPTLTEPPAAVSSAPMPHDAGDATRIEVIELEAAGPANATAPASGADDPDDLFARMDGMLGTEQKSPQK